MIYIHCDVSHHVGAGWGTKPSHERWCRGATTGTGQKYRHRHTFDNNNKNTEHNAEDEDDARQRLRRLHRHPGTSTVFVVGFRGCFVGVKDNVHNACWHVQRFGAVARQVQLVSQGSEGGATVDESMETAGA
jgi:hypothetical protein